ncbi:MAG: DegT/DnrJ/EryC1/StrS aminotransferase family protein, partial [Candidatus Accumulibacter sp.]|nr:DegT/DnrJ/EryC1/StrS aminotransferase family protein [Accumulibacter sp.]
MSAPLLPITRPSIDEETIAAVCAVLRSGWITSGPKVQAFEAALAELCGGRPVRAFNSGTATLEVALRLAG